MDTSNKATALGSLQFLTGPLAGQSVPINKPLVNIGRGPSNDIVISDPSVSREHAQIAWNGDVWTIRKLTAQNMLFLNQKEISQSPLTDRDKIGLGQGTTCIIHFAESYQPRPPATERGSNIGNIGLAAAQQPGQNQPRANGAPAQQPMGQVSSPGYSPSDATVAESAPTPQAAFNATPGYNMPPVAQQAMNTPAATPPGYPVGQQGQMSMPPGSVYPQSSPDNDFMTATQRGTIDRVTGIPSLEISTNTDHNKQLHTLAPDRQIYDIGRDPSNTIVINRPTVSSFHAQIVREGNQLVLIHPHPKREHTLNGLSYNGQNVAGTQQFRTALKTGDVIRISDQNGTFVSLTFNDGSGQTEQELIEMPPIPLGAPVITIGRAADNTVVLKHPQISGHHARLDQLPDRNYRLIDLNSTNHVYINAQRISSQVLKAGDIIRIGPYKLTYTGTHIAPQDESNGIRIDAIHLRKEGNKHVILLNDISFTIPPRNFVALVGGSGAGKSTLMDALNGLRPAKEGQVYYNGQDYYRNLASFSTQLGYVPQDDIIHRDLSVERALYYAAKLRLPEDFTEKQIQERVNEVLEDVEMKHRRSLLVSKLSGGQRKRVSIALELLANPSVFFLDEPTSGLDPGLDRKMMLLLRKLADKGHTIILVTHATNNINACDYICFLAQGGKVAYFGPPNEAKTYFGKTDFAEIYSALEPTDENPNIPAEAEEKFRHSPEYQQYVLTQLQNSPGGFNNPARPAGEVRPPKRGNPWKQFFLLSMRYIELILNDRVNLAILVLQAPIIGLLLFSMTSSGTFAAQNIVTCTHISNITNRTSFSCDDLKRELNGQAGDIEAAQTGKTKSQLFQLGIDFGSGGNAQKILFIMIFSAIMFGCINGAREIVKEEPIYRRERSVNLGLAPYLFSKIVVLGIFSLLQSLILVVIVNAKSPFTTSIILPPFLEIYISMALTSLAGLMTGLLISAIVPNNDRAMSLVPLPLIPQVIFAGVIFSLDNPKGLQIPGAFFAARWAMAAMGSSIGLHGDKVGADSFSYQGTLFTSFNGPSPLAGALSHLLLCWFVLAAMSAVQILLIAWFLKKKDVHK